MPQPPIITLLTDFGMQDHYVAVMKGVILGITPQVRIVDITHEVEPQNILAGAYLLAGSFAWFPSGTIHLAVVDPGVGSDRGILAGRWAGHIIIAPNNGLVSLVHETAPLEELYDVQRREFFLPEVSDTFHGRDKMAPLAAHLAAGRRLDEVGPPLNQPLTVHLPQPRREHDRLIGQIIHVDRFGNLISNISAMQLRGWSRPRIQIRRHTLPKLSRTFAEGLEGAPVALIGSSQMLEVAVNQGNAAEQLKAGVGDEIVVSQ